jgi:hypothetical protein
LNARYRLEAFANRAARTSTVHFKNTLKRKEVQAMRRCISSQKVYEKSSFANHTDGHREDAC